MKAPIAVHFIAASLGDQSMTFTLSQVNALLTKAAYVGAPSYEIKEQGMVGSRTLALFCHPPTAGVVAAEAEQYGPLTRLLIHEAERDTDLASQRESEGMAYSDDETDHRPSNED